MSNTNTQKNTAPLNSTFNRLNQAGKGRLDDVKESRPNIYVTKKTKVKILNADDNESDLQRGQKKRKKKTKKKNQKH
jgi:hypothetical protein